MRKLRRTKPMMWLMVLTMLVSMIGIVPMAMAAGDYSALRVPTLVDDSDDPQALGGVKIEVAAGALEDGDVLSIILPDDVVMDNYDDFAVVATAGSGNELVVPNEISGDDNAITADMIEVVTLEDDEIQIRIDGNPLPTEDAVMYLYLREVIVEDGASGDLIMTFDAPANSGFSSGELVVGRIGTGDVTVTVRSKDTSNDDFEVTLRITENVAGALKVNNESLKFALPKGFEWNTGFDYTHRWGEDIEADLDVDVDDDKLMLDFDGPATQDPTSFEIELSFYVSDESRAKYGDVVAKVTGKSDLDNDNELVVGVYGDFGGIVEAKGDIPTVYAGQLEQEIADIQISELLADTFIDGRTITLTLPSQAKWYKVDDTLVDELENGDALDRDAGDTLEFAGLVGSDKQTLRLKVTGNGDSDEAELLLEDCEIAIQQGFKGDVVVTVGGSQGLTGEVVVAECVQVVSIEASSKPQVKIGLADQVIGDFTITEVVAGAIKDDNPNVAGTPTMLLDAPDGVQFSTVPKVEVVEGDLEIDENNVTRANNSNQIVIPIKDSSTVVSTIKVSGMKLTIDRTVVEGDVLVKVQGGAVTQTGPAALGGNNMWVNAATAAQTVMATVITPAPGETTQTAVFTIGSTEYKVGNATNTMDVAPYIKDDRTYLPIRYVGYALGIADHNILWDDASKTATLIQGDKVVQVKIGSTTMMVNGVAIAMDVAPEITSDRTMLPFRFIGQAFGADFAWDDATKTVTMTL